LSTVVVNNRHVAEEILTAGEVSILKGFAPYLSHNPATFWRSGRHRIAGRQWGLPVFSSTEETGVPAFSLRPETSRDRSADMVVRDPGLPFGH
jgi:hypothetical protein